MFFLALDNELFCDLMKLGWVRDTLLGGGGDAPRSSSILLAAIYPHIPRGKGVLCGGLISIHLASLSPHILQLKTDNGPIFHARRWRRWAKGVCLCHALPRCSWWVGRVWTLEFVLFLLCSEARMPAAAQDELYAGRWCGNCSLWGTVPRKKEKSTQGISISKNEITKKNLIILGICHIAQQRKKTCFFAQSRKKNQDTCWGVLDILQITCMSSNHHAWFWFRKAKKKIFSPAFSVEIISGRSGSCATCRNNCRRMLVPAEGAQMPDVFILVV